MNKQRGKTGDYSQEIGTRIRRLRELMDLTQKDLEKITGIGDAVICRYEQGESSIPLNKLEVIAEALKIDPHTLCGPTVAFVDIAASRMTGGGK